MDVYMYIHKASHKGIGVKDFYNNLCTGGVCISKYICRYAFCVKNGSDMAQNKSGMVPEHSQTLLEYVCKQNCCLSENTTQP